MTTLTMDQLTMQMIMKLIVIDLFSILMGMKMNVMDFMETKLKMKGMNFMEIKLNIKVMDFIMLKMYLKMKVMIFFGNEDVFEDEGGAKDDILVNVDIGVNADGRESHIQINNVVNILNLDQETLTGDDFPRIDFLDHEVAYLFYTWNAKFTDFFVCKSHVLRNKNGQVIQQTFLCSRAGEKKRVLSMSQRKRKTRNETCCECKAFFCVHISQHNHNWYVSKGKYYHNHAMLDRRYCPLLVAHKNMTTTNIMQIDNFRKVGIRIPHIFAAFANISSGYENVGFVMKDIYNQYGKQRHEQSFDIIGMLNKDMNKVSMLQV